MSRGAVGAAQPADEAKIEFATVDVDSGDGHAHRVAKAERVSAAEAL